MGLAGLYGVRRMRPGRPLRRPLQEVGRFDEGYGFFHGCDRELSFAVREAGYRCVVVNAPFVHHGGGSRTGRPAPLKTAEDLAQRRAALPASPAGGDTACPATSAACASG